MRLCIVVFILALFFVERPQNGLSLAKGFAAERPVEATLIRSQDPKETIDSLDLKIKAAKLLIAEIYHVKTVYVIIEGFYKGPGEWKFESQDKPLTLRPDKTFWLAGSFVGDEGRFSIKAIGPNGETKTEVFKLKAKEIPVPKKLLLDFFLTGAKVRYDEEKIGFTHIVLGLGSNLTYFFAHPKLQMDFGVYSDLTVFQTATPNISAKFFKFYTQLGYNIYFHPKLALELKLGLSSQTMFNKQASFGSYTLIIPRLYPQIRWYVGASELYAYFRYMTASRSFSLASKELKWAAGLGWTITTKAERRWTFAVDYLSFQYNPNKATSVKEDAVSFSIGYGVSYE